MPNTQERLLLRLDARTGKILWQRTVLTAAPEYIHHEKSLASSTPVTDGERVFTSFQSGKRADIPVRRKMFRPQGQRTRALFLLASGRGQEYPRPARLRGVNRNKGTFGRKRESQSHRKDMGGGETNRGRERKPGNRSKQVSYSERRPDTPMNGGVNESASATRYVPHILLNGIPWKSGHPRNSVLHSAPAPPERQSRRTPSAHLGNRDCMVPGMLAFSRAMRLTVERMDMTGSGGRKAGHRPTLHPAANASGG